MVSGILLAVVSPFDQEVMAATLFLGMIIRTRSCGIRPSIMPPGLGSGFILLVPLWPALVAVDDLWSWMQRVGFGSVFRTLVTAVLFTLSWVPFMDVTQSFNAPLITAAAAGTALLRERQVGYWYLIPSVVPIGIAGASW